MRVSIPFSKDGYIKLSQLQQVLEPVADAIAESLSSLADRIEKQDGQIKKLQSELDAERRLRMANCRRR